MSTPKNHNDTQPDAPTQEDAEGVSPQVGSDDESLKAHEEDPNSWPLQADRMAIRCL